MPKPSQDSMYWSLPIRGITKAQEELASQKVKVKYFFYDKYSETSFNKVSRDIIWPNFDGLLMAPVLSKVFDQFIKVIPENLPYVFFDSFLPQANCLSYIGQDSFQSGILSGRLMQLLIKEAGAIAVLKILPEDYHIDDRVHGFLSFCKRCSHIDTRVYEIDGNKSRAALHRIFKRIFAENSGLRGIFVTNASTHQIAEYVKSHPPQNKVHIIGYDLIEENIRYLREGVIDFLISQQSEKQGYEGIYALYRHIVLKEPVEKKIMMQLDVVTSENIDYYKS